MLDCRSWVYHVVSNQCNKTVTNKRDATRLVKEWGIPVQACYTTHNGRYIGRGFVTRKEAKAKGEHN